MTLLKRITATFVLFLTLSLFSTATFGQNIPEKGTIGLSASFQGNQTNLTMPIWTSDNVVIAPLLGIVHETDSFTTINLGVKPRFYRAMGDDFASYFGFQGLLQNNSPEFGDDVTNFLIGINGGGEYFLNTHFSMAVEGQLNFLIRDNTDDRISTGAAITGTYYF
ncbi:MAG: hypothetical protein R3222_06805 [Balneolaceae bacterium]|nr:hypothetical protein [Balneolaceae bacterium]